MSPNPTPSFSRTRAFVTGAILSVLIVGGVTATFAAESHRVAQRNRTFEPSQITVAPGDTIDFSNEDTFIHQIYIDSPALKIDSDEQSHGQIISVKFPTAGTFDVRCRIHPKMVLKVEVK